MWTHCNIFYPIGRNPPVLQTFPNPIICASFPMQTLPPQNLWSNLSCCERKIPSPQITVNPCGEGKKGWDDEGESFWPLPKSSQITSRLVKCVFLVE